MQKDANFVLDMYYNGHDNKIEEIRYPRIKTKNTHGTGCTYSAAIAGALGRGVPMLQAILKARQYLQRAITEAPAIGHGTGPLNHLCATPTTLADHLYHALMESAITNE